MIIVLLLFRGFLWIFVSGKRYERMRVLWRKILRRNLEPVHQRGRKRFSAPAELDLSLVSCNGSIQFICEEKWCQQKGIPTFRFISVVNQGNMTTFQYRLSGQVLRNKR